MVISIFYILIIIIFIDFIFCERENKTNHTVNISEIIKEEEVIDHFANDEVFTQKLIADFGFNQGTIHRQNFKKFLFKLIVKEEKIDETEKVFYEEVVARVAKSIPEEFDHSNLNKYIDHDSIVKALDSVIADEYGEKTLREVQSVSDKYDKEDL